MRPLVGGRTSTATETKLDQRRFREEIALGEFRTIVNVFLVYEDCGKQAAVTYFIEGEGCECE